MKEALAHIVNYIDGLPDDYDPGETLMRIRGKIESLLKSEQELQRSVASKAQSTGEPSQKTTECYIPVSVEDELPEAIDGNEKIIVKGNIGWFECRWDSSYGFYDNEPSEEIDWDSITHWLKKTTLSPVKDDWKERVLSLLTNLGQILQIVKGEWQEANCWSEWDEEQINELIKIIKEIYQSRENKHY